VLIEFTDQEGLKISIRNSAILAVKHDDGYTRIFIVGNSFRVLEDYKTVLGMIK